MDNNVITTANNYITENDEVSSSIKIFYSDLNLKKRAEILKHIDKSNEMINIFNDTIVKDSIMDTFSKKPIFIITGQELINKMNFEF